MAQKIQADQLYRGEFRPYPTFSSETHDLLISGKLRTDYHLESDSDGERVIIVDDLSYDDICNVQIVRRYPPSPWYISKDQDDRVRVKANLQAG
jgi:hypothetical protein